MIIEYARHNIYIYIYIISKMTCMMSLPKEIEIERERERGKSYFLINYLYGIKRRDITMR